MKGKIHLYTALCEQTSFLPTVTKISLQEHLRTLEFFTEFHGFSNQGKLHSYNAFIKPHYRSKYLNLPLFCLDKEPRMVKHICNAKEALLLQDAVPNVV